MTTEEKTAKLADIQKKLYALRYAQCAIEIDEATTAPFDTSEGRCEALGVLSSYQYDLSTSAETIDLLESLRDDPEGLTDHQKREVELLLRDNDYLKNIPEEEYIDYQKTLSGAFPVWRKAKEGNDFASFLPTLRKMFDFNIRFAKYYRPDQPAYNTQMDLYERGLTMDQCDEFFGTLKEHIVPLIQKIGEKDQIDDSRLKVFVPVGTQRKITEYLMSYMGIDPGHCNCEETEHPFTENLNNKDVRITTHYFENDFANSMFSVIHEGGHALYELGGGDEHEYTSVAGGVSMGIHESISRFYENIIGRNRKFLEGILPEIKKLVPEIADISSEDFYRMINKAQPSLIRVDADELTYPLHVMIRYEIEKKMFAGEMEAEDIPEAWNRLYMDYLGVEVPNDTKGCLQDSHWAGGNIGYFPSYSLGSAYGAQYLDTMKKDIAFDDILSSGSLKPINEWFGSKIFNYSSMYDPKCLFEKVCGKGFDPLYYTDYLEKKFGEIYGL